MSQRLPRHIVLLLILYHPLPPVRTRVLLQLTLYLARMQRNAQDAVFPEQPLIQPNRIQHVGGLALSVGCERDVDHFLVNIQLGHSHHGEIRLRARGAAMRAW